MRIVSNNGLGKLVVLFTVVAMLFTLFTVVPNEASAAPTTSLTIKKLASDKTTVLDQRTVTFQELRDGQLSDGTAIPILGDGSTRYYHQGPVFVDDPDPETQELLRWNEAEDHNWDTKDMGALKGTNLKDLCELVGGMAEGDTIQIKATDGFKKDFAYKNVYQYSDREGPMVICWYNDGQYPDTGYRDGMRLVWFAEATYKEGPTSIMELPSGYYNVFGNWDWRLAAEPKYWYYYNNQYPTTTGLSVQTVSELVIYSTQAPKATWYVDDSGEADFTTIQAAVTAANAGDTIIVKDGTYTENVVVDKSLVIKSENGVAQTTVQAAEPSADVIKVTAPDVTIDGFTVTGATSMGRTGIYIAGQSSGSCTVKNNLCTGNNQGIAVASSGNTVSNNTCTLSARYGIFLTNATDNLITNNTCSNNTAGSGYALYLADNANNNTVSGNTSDSNLIGIRVKNAYSNIIFNNTSSNNNYGLEIATGSIDNVFYLNNFTDNTSSQLSSGYGAVAGNIWSSQEELTYEFNGTQYTGYVGNYWSDYEGADADGNGIGDMPYQTIATDTDNYPLIGLYQDGVITGSGPPAVDVLYDGIVALAPGETFSVTAYNSGTAYDVSETTPLGALQAAATAGGFTYDVTDKNYTNSEALLLDNIGDYPFVKGGSKWLAYVNDAYKDGYNNAAGALNLIELVDGDRVEFYYAAGISEPTDLDAVKAAATAAVKTVAATGASPTDWTLQLSGAKNTAVTKDYFERGLACSSSTHQVFWTDEDGNVWGGVPLWLLVGMVDDNPDVGPDHYNFNDELAAKKYHVNVISSDGWKETLDSAAIARNDGYIIANTLNGEPLPLQTEGGKVCWPLHLKGSAIFGGQQVGGIVKIELADLPQPSEGWTLKMLGKIGDTITQKEFEDGLACTGSGHYKEWTDNEGNVWSGVPLWVLAGVVDDLELSGHWTFNDSLAAGYSVKVVAADGFAKTFNGADVAHSSDYIVANKMNGDLLTGDAAPLRLVGVGVAKTDGSLGGGSVGNIARIEMPELQTPPAAPGSWNLTLKGKISQVISQAEFEDALACPKSNHNVEWTDGDGNVWSGMPLWFLAGRVDDRLPSSFDTNLASAGYTILVKAGDSYTKDFASTDVARNNNYIIANKRNGEPLTDSWPLRLVGAGVAKAGGSLSGTSVGNVAEIELTSFNPVLPAPAVRIVKYAEDHTTIIDEITVDYRWMESESGFDVIGDGVTLYRYEGITNNPDDIWDADETYPGGFKIANAVKGTRVRDLCSLVGGMGAGTDIVFVAKDGFETTLPYSCIYPDPAVQARQGDAILAWWGDGNYVPDYADGMRLFFTPDDHIYGQWDMHETIPSKYWHYYFGGGVQYPSCAGLSPKWITEIKIYSVPQGDWTMELDGRDIGGLDYDVTKTYFEQALVCKFGANHKATYTDSEERVWEGMPLWLLAGFVDDADQHSDNAFNKELALAGYQVVITGADGHSVTIDSKDIIRNNDYIIANTLNGALIPESDDSWPLRLVGPAVSGETSVSQIVSIKLVSSEPGEPSYTVTPEEDAVYTPGTTPEGIKTMTVNDGVSGFKYFTVGITPVVSHDGDEAAVFTHLRKGSQLELNATRADFDQVNTAQAGFNVKAGDVIKVYLVDELTNAIDHNPVILQ